LIPFLGGGTAAPWKRGTGTELAATASDPLLVPVLAVVKRLDPRVHVSVRRFVRARSYVRARRHAGRLRYGLVGRALYGLQKLVSSMAADISTRPGHQPLLPQEIAAQLRGLLVPGDVLITRKEFAATNYFLPGYWKHAAMYLGTPTALAGLGIAEHENVRPRWARLLEVDAEDLVGMSIDRRHFDPVAVYAPRHEASVLTGAAAQRMLRQTHAPT